MKKQDGFPGQMSYVMPDRIVEMVRQNPLISDLYITDIGYYPQARNHFRERASGISQFILIYNIAGKGSISVGNTKYEIPADHFFIIPQNIPHSYSADSIDPWSVYWIHFTGTKAVQFSKFSLQTMVVERGKTSRINERIEIFSEIFRNLERGFSVETLEYINLCLGHLLASFTYLSKYRIVKEVYEKDPVGQSINFMLENMNQKFRLDELSREVKLSVSHYSRLFLSKTGHSPIDYFIQLKIQQACRLLDNTNWSIAEIARETGFDDQFYFSRQFRKAMNMAPREYRKR